MNRTLFLGGTIGNDYRERLTTILTDQGVSLDRIFNPVVEHWDAEAQRLEDEKKADPSVLMLFYLRGEEVSGNFLSFYSLHEAEMGLYDQPCRTIVVFDYEGMVPRAEKRLRKVRADLRKRFPEAPLFESLDEAAAWLLLKLT